ncbi:hypothetical protein AV654_19510 [Paenibacillus elgii]|uniref:Uncharacterized protein n=1 Tax=Paenibacillus elgii TaxID=189691 RepID=A0A161SCL6_9BACL|nr:hypothetical protein [Paenibacillus elgii]KZE78165.1 hypothetical protein AV654_19510 [Paenibacillus elgii]
MGRQVVPGKSTGIKPRMDENEFIIKWMNMQTNLMDSFRILMEQEISAHGLRNLQEHIPASRPELVLGPPKIDSAATFQPKNATSIQLRDAAALEKESSASLEALKSPVEIHSGQTQDSIKGTEKVQEKPISTVSETIPAQPARRISPLMDLDPDTAGF